MLIGREKEQALLRQMLASDESEFVAVYGRRRVGKTYLVRETLYDHMVFQHTGLHDVKKPGQLKEFSRSLQLAGMAKVPRMKDWFDAFFALEQFLQNRPEGKKVVFIDELPWMDTPKSNLVAALDHFWNGWASARKDIVLVCQHTSNAFVSQRAARQTVRQARRVR